jgi:hypothetical protein
LDRFGREFLNHTRRNVFKDSGRRRRIVEVRTGDEQVITRRIAGSSSEASGRTLDSVGNGAATATGPLSLAPRRSTGCAARPRFDGSINTTEAM